MQVEKTENKKWNATELSWEIEMKMQEIKMIYLLTWGLGPQEVMFLEYRFIEGTHPLVMAYFSHPWWESSTSLY